MDTGKKEIWSIIISILLMSVILCFIENEFLPSVFLSSLLISSIILFASVLSKKAVAHYIDVEIKHKLWEFKRFWITSWAHLKKPAPIGLILPVLLAFLSGGAIKFIAFLQFESKALPSKAVKKYGTPRYSGLTEWDDALIVFYSTLSILILSIAVSFSNLAFLENLSKYLLIFAISNLLPLGKLDGTKLFFGSRPLFFFTWILAVITALTIAF